MEDKRNPSNLLLTVNHQWKDSTFQSISKGCLLSLEEFESRFSVRSGLLGRLYGERARRVRILATR
jgi:hypothetical protein